MSEAAGPGIRTWATIVTLVTLALVGAAGCSANRSERSRGEVPDLGCNRPEELAGLARSLEEALDCREAEARGSRDACEPVGPPSCAGGFVDDVVRLVYGPDAQVPPGALDDQQECRRRMGRAVARYAVSKLQGLADGLGPEQADARAASELEAIPSTCDVATVRDERGGLFPSVGPQCAAAVEGGRVDAVALHDCVHRLLDVWVDRIGPYPSPLRPNILLILTDDQRWDTLDGTHGEGRRHVMPTVMEDLAGAGIRFSNAFVANPSCSPSRAGILTGRYAHHTGVRTNYPPAGGATSFDDAASVATWLSEAGYRTGYIGKYLNGWARLRKQLGEDYVPRGWDESHILITGTAYFDYTLIENGSPVTYGSADEDYLTDVLRDKAVEFIEDSVRADRPFFLQLSTLAPHGPADPAPRHAGDFGDAQPHRPASYNESDVSDKPSWVKQTRPIPGGGKLDRQRVRQLESLQAVDEALAALLGVLERLGVAEDTLVVLFSDNGVHWGEHRLRTKNTPYEESIRSPMVLRYPRLVPLPRTDGRLVLNIDLAPSFAALAGVRPVPEPDGLSWVGVLDGTERAWRQDFFAEGFWGTEQHWASVRTPQWKYVEYRNGEQELYDLRADPLELDSLAAGEGQASRLFEMAARLRVLRPDWPATVR